jgi:hypothetical protein
MSDYLPIVTEICDTIFWGLVVVTVGKVVVTVGKVVVMAIMRTGE